jgi:hypothetical protein
MRIPARRIGPIVLIHAFDVGTIMRICDWFEKELGNVFVNPECAPYALRRHLSDELPLATGIPEGLSVNCTPSNPEERLPDSTRTPRFTFKPHRTNTPAPTYTALLDAFSGENY